MLLNSFIDFTFEHWSGCWDTEPGYAGDIGAIEIWLIDWFSLLVTSTSVVSAFTIITFLHTHQKHARVYSLHCCMQWASHNLRHCLAGSLSFPGKPDTGEIFHGCTHKIQAVTLYLIILLQDICALLMLAHGLSKLLLRLCTRNILVDEHGLSKLLLRLCTHSILVDGCNPSFNQHASTLCCKSASRTHLSCHTTLIDT